ncbi:MBL fold metallo-hydrolase [Chitinophaga sp. sic0106]|nr:MBL fold metallo-hydrolase [Chitinophaga sp. sic0106]
MGICVIISDKSIITDESAVNIVALQSHIEGKKYQNPVPTSMAIANMPALMWKYLTYKGKRSPLMPLGPFHVTPAALLPAASQELQLTWLGHSSYILELDGKRLIIDPVFASRASPFSFMGPKRFFASPVLPAELPPIDVVLLSHDHYDHLDRHMMHFLSKKVKQFVCPKGVERHLLRWGIPAANIAVLDWSESFQISDTLRLTATPARHFSGRWFQRNETLWSSYVLEGRDKKVFIGGDSGYFDGFAEIGATYGPFDLTILEIGAYDVNWPDIHMGPEKATQAHLALKGNVMLPVHWGTFNLAFHDWDEPAEKIVQLAEEKNITLWMPAPGETGLLPEHNKISYWWRAYK